MYPPPCMKNITLSFSLGCKSNCRKIHKRKTKTKTIQEKSMSMPWTTCHFQFPKFNYLVCTHLGTSNPLRPRIGKNWMWFVSILRQIRWHFERRSTVQSVAVPKMDFILVFLFDELLVFLYEKNTSILIKPIEHILHESVMGQWVALHTGYLGMRRIYADPIALLQCDHPNLHFLFSQ